MSSSITMSVLRGEAGKQYGTWIAREVTGTTAAPRLTIECSLCGHRQIVDVHQWHSITTGRSIQCANFGNHKQAPKAATPLLSNFCLASAMAD